MRSPLARALTLGLVAAAPLLADPLGAAVAAGVRDQAAGRAAAAAVDAARARAREAALAAAHARERQASLATYSDQVARMMARQQEELARLERELAGLDQTRREVGPWLARMHATLVEFVARDLPFDRERRQARTAHLGELLERPDLALAEKARRVLEAYRLEVATGRRIEAARGEVDLGAGLRMVDLLRVGRVALYYRTLEGREVGWWDAATSAWRPLAPEHRAGIEHGLRVARQKTPPGLLRLPVPPPTSGGGRS